MSHLLGIDIGGTYIKFLGCRLDGEIVWQSERPTEDRDPLNWTSHLPRFAEVIQSEIDAIRTKLGKETGIGLCAPGLADPGGRFIRHMPGRMHGIEGLDWASLLGSPIEVLNDAHAALLGEIWLGAAQNLQNVILLTLGTGVGGAIFAEGRLLKGAIGRAGHLGHICLDTGGRPSITGMPGSLEEAVGECGVERRSRGHFGSTVEIMKAHQSGDAFATRLWADLVRALACGVASLINVIDPEVVLLGGGISNAGDALLLPLKEELGRIEWRPEGHPVELRFATLGNWAGAYGAASTALPRAH